MKHLRRITVLVCAALLGATTGCSGGGDDDGPGSSGALADEALADTTCYLGLQVPGVSFRGIGCSGTPTLTSVTGLKDSSFEAAVRVTLELGTPPAVGALDLTSLTVVVPDSTGTEQSWEAPVGACTAQAVGTQRDDFFEWDYYRMDLSCTEQAMGVDGNTAAPLELGDFIVVSFFAP